MARGVMIMSEDDSLYLFMVILNHH